MAIEEKNVAHTVKFSPIYKEKIDDYIKMLKENNVKTEDGKQYTTGILLNSIFNDFFKDKMLTNDFIDLPKAYYFNWDSLLEHKQTEATPYKPITHHRNIMIMKRVPNNLDAFDKKEKCYCYNENINKHKGFYIYNYSTYSSDITEDTVNLIFEYDAIEEKITIQLIETWDTKYFIDPEIYEEIKNSTNYELDNTFYEDIDTTVGLQDVEIYVNIDVMMPYTHYRNIELALKEDRVREHILKNSSYDRPICVYYRLVNGIDYTSNNPKSYYEYKKPKLKIIKRTKEEIEMHNKQLEEDSIEE